MDILGLVEKFLKYLFVSLFMLFNYSQSGNVKNFNADTIENLICSTFGLFSN